MKLLWYLTGGRPMIYLKSLFIDNVSHRIVNLYRDRLDRKWMAEHPWGTFRIRMKSD